MIQRYYKLEDYIEPGKVLLIYGPRRVGKTSLVKGFLESYGKRFFYAQGEDRDVRAVLGAMSTGLLKTEYSDYDLICIDEAQSIDEIGTSLKLLIDTLGDKVVIATGSSSFDLAQKVGEPLTGRKKTIQLYPLSVMELKHEWGGAVVRQKLDTLLIYGNYPESLMLEGRRKKEDYLRELCSSYLYKDILTLENIRHSRKIDRLLQLIAFQIGQEVSLGELGAQLELSKETVGKYLDLLEKTFVIVSVRGFHRNLRKEIVKSSRYYFLDNGVRNAVTDNFKTLDNRDDVGALWENFCFIERVKRNHYLGRHVKYYFWRTYDQQEIDLIEVEDDELRAIEFKYSPKIKARVPGAWSKAYPEAKFLVINSANFLEFLGVNLPTKVDHSD